jgi:hypothetical protein
LLFDSCWFLTWRTLQPWRCRRQHRPRCRLTFNGLHGVISKKEENLRNDRRVFESEGIVAGFSSRPPGFDPRSDHVGIVVEKWQWGRFSPSASVFPDNSHSTDCSTLIYHLGLVQ